jgi:hypothetical protein
LAGKEGPVVRRDGVDVSLFVRRQDVIPECYVGGFGGDWTRGPTQPTEALGCADHRSPSGPGGAFRSLGGAILSSPDLVPNT